MTKIEEIKQLKKIRKDLQSLIKQEEAITPHNSNSYALKAQTIKKYYKQLETIERSIQRLRIELAISTIFEDLEKANNTEEFYAVLSKYYKKSS